MLIVDDFTVADFLTNPQARITIQSEDQFEKKFGKRQEEVLGLLHDIMLDYSMPLQTELKTIKSLSDLLKSERTFFLTAYPSEGSTAFELAMDPIKSESKTILDGQKGWYREASSYPILVNRPSVGFFEEVAIKGLVDCIGVVMYPATQNGPIEAVSGAHFVTDLLTAKVADKAQAVDKNATRAVNEEGERALLKQLKVTMRANEAVVVTLLHVDQSGSVGKASNAAIEGYQGMNGIEQFLRSKNVTQVSRSNGVGDRMYRLLANGTGSLVK